MHRISVQNGVLKTSQNTRIGIRYKSKCGQTKEAHIIADIAKNNYIAQFEEDNVDFVIWIDCINHVEKRKFNYKLTVRDKTYSFMVDNGKYRELKALVSKGHHLHFASAPNEKLSTGQNRRHSMDNSGDALTNLKFDLCYSTFIKISIDMLSLNLLRPIKMSILMPYNEKVENIKKEIVSKLATDLQIQKMELYAGCGNILLDDANTLDKYNVNNGEILFVRFVSNYRNEKFSVFVQTIERKRIEIQVPSSHMTIRELKNAIQKNGDNGSFAFDTVEHQITCIGYPLNDLFTLDDYGIKPKTLLHIEANALAKKQIRLFVKMANGNMMALEAGIQDTIENLKAQIYMKCGIRVDQQRISYQGVDLANQSSIGFYQLYSECTLQLTVSIRSTVVGSASHDTLPQRELNENPADKVSGEQAKVKIQPNVAKYKLAEKETDCIGEKTNQKMRQNQFVRDKNINIEAFVIEMRLQSENNNLF